MGGGSGRRNIKTTSTQNVGRKSVLGFQFREEEVEEEVGRRKHSSEYERRNEKVR